MNLTIVSDTLSPYELAKFVNAATNRNLPTQMMYNYVSKNMIPSHRDHNNKIRITREDAVKFVQKYMEKNCK